MTRIGILERPVARKTPTPPPTTPGEGPEPSSETARIAIDLMEMLRDIQDDERHARGGKRPKITQLLDNILRPALVREWQRRGLAKKKAD